LKGIGKKLLFYKTSFFGLVGGGGGGGGTPYNGPYREALPKRGTFFRLQVCKREGISQVEVYKREGKSFI